MHYRDANYSISRNKVNLHHEEFMLDGVVGGEDHDMQNTNEVRAELDSLLRLDPDTNSIIDALHISQPIEVQYYVLCNKSYSRLLYPTLSQQAPPPWQVDWTMGDN